MKTKQNKPANGRLTISIRSEAREQIEKHQSRILIKTGARISAAQIVETAVAYYTKAQGN
jgi:hypothetical protein